MDELSIVRLLGQGLQLVILCVCVLVVPGLFVGLVVSMFQAATQINEQTLSFLPRLLTTLGAILLTGSWLMNEIIDYARELILSLPILVMT